MNVLSEDLWCDPTYIFNSIRLSINDEVLVKLGGQCWIGARVYSWVVKVHLCFIAVAPLHRHFTKLTLQWTSGLAGIGAEMKQAQEEFHNYSARTRVYSATICRAL
jgi:hypothetical protein